MSREIKFRAWVNNEMHYDWGIESGLGSALWLKMFGHITPEVAQSNGYSLPEKYDFYNNWEFMQYTGLKDRNGVEIYEGDILEMAEQSLLRFEVVYDAGHMAFMRKWIDKRVPATRCKGEMEHLSANTDFLEVVGNRFENPDLI